MDTQNTQVHIHLWHRDFWILSIVNLLLSTVVYMQLTVLANALYDDRSLNVDNIGRALIIGVYGLGIFILGPYCHYLCERYKRKRVCQGAVMGMMAISIGVPFAIRYLSGYPFFITAIVGMFWYGAFFGLAQMVLSSTIIIDVAKSEQRTEANYVSAWFRRFAIAAGPFMAIAFPHAIFDVSVCVWVYVAIIVLLNMINLPFKTPDDNTHVFCLDRFLMPQGVRLMVTLMPITAVLGMSAAMAFRGNDVFFLQFAIGLAIALIAERLLFVNADLQSEFIAGGMLILAALLLYIFRSGMEIVEHLAPTLIGIGVGLIGGRMQMFFNKMAGHCQRGTAQSSFFLSWELGFALGLALALWLADYHILDVIGLTLTVVSMVVYHFYTHPWYMAHKSR